MIYGVLKKNTYQDSVNLMVLSSKLSDLDGVKQVSIMMGTPANKDIFKNTDMYSSEFDDASPNDICIAVDTEDSSLVEVVAQELEDFITDLSSKTKSSKLVVSKTLSGALDNIENPNLALISIPGEYVYEEADKLLDKDMNIFIFSDNVELEDEKKLKDKAHEKGLIVMGPDCGTGIISNVPLAFANVVPKGNIGVIGASGTGIQEVTSIVGRNGGGISHAIGLGGRDLKDEIGGTSAIDALNMLNKDENTDVIVFISKPPAQAIKNKVIETLEKLDKKVVAIFLGEKIEDGEIQYAFTLEEAAYKALALSKSIGNYNNLDSIRDKLDTIKKNKEQTKVQGYYGGGTLAGEAVILFAEHFDISEGNEKEGYMLHFDGNEIIDYGDDMYTQGRPHPMIDPSTRIAAIKELKDREDVAVVLLDNVIGYGGNPDMAGELAPHIKDLIDYKQDNGKDILFIAAVCGTEEDIQVYSDQVAKLREVGVLVLDTNAEAVYTAIDALDYLKNENLDEDKKVEENLLNGGLRVVNLGLKSFAETILSHGGQVVQYDWAPIAGGDKKMQGILNALNSL